MTAGISGAARRAARSASHAAGTLTAPGRMLPAFLIVGAQRCGTTSLFKALAQHPAVRPPFGFKGIHYFDVAYDRGASWYRGHFPVVRPGSRAVTGESSPYYMFHPLAPARMASDLPDVRLVVALRDPAERAYSAHAHELARGFETEPFERALELEASRLAGEAERLAAEPGYVSHSHRHHAYRARGHYAEQLQRLEQHAGRDKIHVVDSEQLFAAPERVLGDLLAFLGLSPCSSITFGWHNARSRSAMSAAVRRSLDEYFAPHDERLTDWLGHPPAWRARNS